jgi:hypothetical protein
VKRECPAPVFVLALASLVLGGFGLVGAAIPTVVCWAFGGPGSPGVVVPLTPAAAAHLRGDLLGFRAFELLLPGTEILLAALVFATGLGLLGMRRPARKAAIVTAAVVLGVQLLTALYQFGVVLPAIGSWREAVSRNVHRPGGYDFAPVELRWVALLLLIGGLTFFLHALATLAVLYAPTVAEAFERGKRAEPAGD